MPTVQQRNLLVLGGGTRVTFDAATLLTGNLPTGSHTVGPNANYLLVVVGDWAVDPLDTEATGCTCDAVSMTVLGSRIITPAGYRMFGLANPGAGAHTITLTTGSAAAPLAVAMSFNNVRSVAPITQAFGGALPATAQVGPTKATSLVVAFVTYFGPNGGITTGVGQTAPSGSRGTSSNTGVAMSYEPGNGSLVTMSESWTTGTDSWALGAVELLS